MIKYRPTDLEKAFQPNCWQLLEDDASAIILDEELDAFECEFNGDGCVNIDTDGMGYIVLSVAHLKGLIYLIDKAEKAQIL